MHTISDNYKRIQDGIASACARAGRNVNEITLIAVTKFVPIERIAPAFGLGIRHVGENRAQEYIEKKDFFTNNGCCTHFIGQLQSNKVKYIIGEVDLIQSVDRLSLALELERQARLKNVIQDILVEVNIGGEPQKGGVSAESLLPFLEEIAHKSLRVKGLMCVPPALSQEDARPYFAQMRALFENCKAVAGVEMVHLSMGMSGDYCAAIEEGATMVRIGSALFGSRV